MSENYDKNGNFKDYPWVVKQIDELTQRISELEKGMSALSVINVSNAQKIETILNTMEEIVNGQNE